MRDAITQPEPHVIEEEDRHFTGEEVQLAANVSTLKTRLITARQFAAQAEFAYGEKYKELIEQLDATKQAWEVENALVVAEHERTKEYLEKTEKEIRQAIVDYCRELGVKRFDDELSVRVLVKLEYEPDTATAWAKTNAPFILVADKKQFEGIAKKQDLDFVTKVPTYAAVIATDLGSDSKNG